MKVAGVILAGGLARRFGGGDKGLRDLAGRPMLDHVIERVSPQVAGLMINAGGEAARFASYGLPVVADVLEGAQGPLAGILTGLEWAAGEGLEWLVSLPSDAPFLPCDLVDRLAAEIQAGADIAVARSAGRRHPVIAIWPVRLAADLRRAMIDEDMRKIDRWTPRFDTRHVDFESEPVDPFFNVNSPEDLERAERLFASA